MFFLSFGRQVGQASPGLALTLLALALVIPCALIYQFVIRNTKAVHASPQEMATALSREPPDGEAAIYLVRRGFIASRLDIDLTVDGIGTGTARANQFLHFEVQPGTYHVTARAPRVDGQTTVMLAAGEIALFRVAVVPRMSGVEITFARIDAEGQKVALAGTRMVTWRQMG